MIAPARVLSRLVLANSRSACALERSDDAERCDAADLTTENVPLKLAAGALVVEDIDGGTSETALFHLLNFAREEGKVLLLTCAMPPAQLALSLPDLVSRLRALPHAALGEPDGALLERLIEKLFADRGIDAKDGMAAYIAKASIASTAARAW